MSQEINHSVYTNFKEAEILIMNYHQNFILSVGALKVAIKDYNKPHKRLIHTSKALRDLDALYDLGRSARVYPHRSYDEEKHEFLENLKVKSAKDVTIEELQKAKKIITDWFEITGFYNLKKNNDRDLITPDFFVKLFGEAGV